MQENTLSLLLDYFVFVVSLVMITVVNVACAIRVQTVVINNFGWRGFIGATVILPPFGIIGYIILLFIRLVFFFFGRKV